MYTKKTYIFLLLILDFTIQTAKMDCGTLTNRQIVQLAKAIASIDLEAIALEYFHIDEEAIRNLRSDQRESAEVFNRSILRNWMHRNRGTNQVQAWLFSVAF